MLWESMLEEANILDKTSVDDGRGGQTTIYKVGLSILAVFGFDTSRESRIAEQANAVPRYTITTRSNVNLQYHDVIQRKRDGQIFRITSDGNDNVSPAVSSLNMRQVEAEKWEIPADEREQSNG